MIPPVLVEIMTYGLVAASGMFDMQHPKGVLYSQHALYTWPSNTSSQQFYLTSCAHLSKTQVSFVPPPCEELTTNDPSFKATLVNPP